MKKLNETRKNYSLQRLMQSVLISVAVPSLTTEQSNTQLTNVLKYVLLTP